MAVTPNYTIFDIMAAKNWWQDSLHCRLNVNISQKRPQWTETYHPITWQRHQLLQISPTEVQKYYKLHWWIVGSTATFYRQQTLEHQHQQSPYQLAIH